MTKRVLDHLMMGCLALTLLAGCAAAAVALYLAGSDLQESGEFLDGVGLAAGGALLVVVGVPSLLAALIARSLR